MKFNPLILILLICFQVNIFKIKLENIIKIFFADKLGSNHCSQQLGPLMFFATRFEEGLLLGLLGLGLTWFLMKETSNSCAKTIQCVKKTLQNKTKNYCILRIFVISLIALL